MKIDGSMQNINNVVPLKRAELKTPVERPQRNEPSPAERTRQKTEKVELREILSSQEKKVLAELFPQDVETLRENSEKDTYSIGRKRESVVQVGKYIDITQ